MSNFIKKTSLFLVLFGALTFGLNAEPGQEAAEIVKPKKAPSKIARFFAPQHRKEAMRSVLVSAAELFGKFSGAGLQQATSWGCDPSTNLFGYILLTGTIPDIVKALTRFGFDCADEKFLQDLEAKASERGQTLEKMLCYLIADATETAVDFTDLDHSKGFCSGYYKDFGPKAGSGFRPTVFGNFALSTALRAIKEDHVGAFVPKTGVFSDLATPALDESKKVIKLLDLEKAMFLNLINSEKDGRINQNKFMSKGVSKAVNEIASRLLARTKLFAKSGKEEKYNRLVASLIAAFFSPISAKGVESVHPVVP